MLQHVRVLSVIQYEQVVYFTRYKTVKFVYVELIGENSNRMMKARVTTHKSFVTEFMKPYHVDFSIDTPSELTEDIINTKVGSTSGSKSLVMDGEAAANRKKVCAWSSLA